MGTYRYLVFDFNIRPGGCGKGFCIVEACLFLVSDRENLSSHCCDFRTAVKNHVKNSVKISKKQEKKT